MLLSWITGLGWHGALFDPVLLSVLFAIWVAIVVIAIHSATEGREQPGPYRRSTRASLDEHLTRSDIDREEYVDRRKALDHITAMV